MQTNKEYEDEYDEFDFPVISNKGFSHSGITMHKLKYDNKYWTKIEQPDPKESNFIKKFNDEHFRKSSLIEHSKILKELEKTTKTNNFLNKFYLDSEDSIKLIYRASEDKEFLFENFIKAYLNTKYKILIMKTFIDMYFIKTLNFPENKWDNVIENYYIFSSGKFKKLDDTYLSVNKDNKLGKPQFELNNYITIFNSYNSGKLLLKSEKNNNKFSVVDLELFSLSNKKYEQTKRISIK